VTAATTFDIDHPDPVINPFTCFYIDPQTGIRTFVSREFTRYSRSNEYEEILEEGQREYFYIQTAPGQKLFHRGSGHELLFADYYDVLLLERKHKGRFFEDIKVIRKNIIPNPGNGIQHGYADEETVLKAKSDRAYWDEEGFLIVEASENAYDPNALFVTLKNHLAIEFRSSGFTNEWRFDLEFTRVYFDGSPNIEGQVTSTGTLMANSGSMGPSNVETPDLFNLFPILQGAYSNSLNDLLALRYGLDWYDQQERMKDGGYFGFDFQFRRYESSYMNHELEWETP
jgi:hypothetical protein